MNIEDIEVWFVLRDMNVPKLGASPIYGCVHQSIKKLTRFEGFNIWRWNADPEIPGLPVMKGIVTLGHPDSNP